MCRSVELSLPECCAEAFQGASVKEHLQATTDNLAAHLPAIEALNALSISLFDPGNLPAADSFASCGSYDLGAHCDHFSDRQVDREAGGEDEHVPGLLEASTVELQMERLPLRSLLSTSY